MKANFTKFIGIITLVSASLPAYAKLDIETIDHELQQLLQALNPTQLAEIGPQAERYRSCLVDEKLFDTEGFNLSRIFSAKAACDPVLDDVFNALGLSSEEQRDKAAAEIYKQVLGNSI